MNIREINIDEIESVVGGSQEESCEAWATGTEYVSSAAGGIIGAVIGGSFGAIIGGAIGGVLGSYAGDAVYDHCMSQ